METYAIHFGVTEKHGQHLTNVMKVAEKFSVEVEGVFFDDSWAQWGEQRWCGHDTMHMSIYYKSNRPASEGKNLAEAIMEITTVTDGYVISLASDWSEQFIDTVDKKSIAADLAAHGNCDKVHA